jgi:hypothetical protein
MTERTLLAEEKVDFARLLDLIRMAGENRKVSAFWADCEAALIELRNIRDPESRS